MRRRPGFSLCVELHQTPPSFHCAIGTRTRGCASKGVRKEDGRLSRAGWERGCGCATRAPKWQNRAVASAHTVTRTKKPRRDAEPGEPYLFIVFRCDRPLEGGARFSLAGAEIVSVGRTARVCCERGREQGASTLRIGVPDPGMSAAHARLQRVLGSWVLADAGSKNGTYCDGRRVERAPLSDGALLELGHTLFVFREALPAGPDVLGAKAEDEPPPGFRHPPPRSRRRAGAPAAHRRIAHPAAGAGRDRHGQGGDRPRDPRHLRPERAFPGDQLRRHRGHPRGVGAVRPPQGRFHRRRRRSSRPRSARRDGGTLFSTRSATCPRPRRRRCCACSRRRRCGRSDWSGPSRSTCACSRRRTAIPTRWSRSSGSGRIARAPLGLSVTLAPLRERREDFGLLAAELLGRAGSDLRHLQHRGGGAGAPPPHLALERSRACAVPGRCPGPRSGCAGGGAAPSRLAARRRRCGATVSTVGRTPPAARS